MTKREQCMTCKYSLDCHNRQSCKGCDMSYTLKVVNKRSILRSTVEVPQCKCCDVSYGVPCPYYKEVSAT